MIRAASVSLLAAMLALGNVAPARAQCEEFTGNPYVFILFDTSASLNLSPPCTSTEVTAGDCSFLCPTGDCFVPLQADDPGSKMYQMKEALGTALAGETGLNLGFASFNQDALRARAKHWLYEATTAGPTNITGQGAFPALGSREVFGLLWNCDTGSGDHDTGCSSAVPADLNDAWEFSRMQRLSKGGTAFNQNVTFYVRRSPNTYRVTYQPLTGTLGASIQVRVTIARCTNPSCTTVTSSSSADVTWQAVSDFLSWDNAGSSPNRTNPELSYFTQSAAADPSATNTCSGWDPNTDSADDLYSSTYSLRWPTDTSDARGAYFHVGDVIPFDWTDAHLDAVLARLAPNLATSPLAIPDVRVAVYLNDVPLTAESFLRLKDEQERPLIALGSTPLDNSIRSFRTWYAGCASGACTPGLGWQGIAEAEDPDWACRRKYLVVLTDGDETCEGDPCSTVADLLDDSDVSTYVVGFGVDPLAATQLSCMAANGGTVNPYHPRNKQQLIDDLDSIFADILTP